VFLSKSAQVTENKGRALQKERKERKRVRNPMKRHGLFAMMV
jgi:hypothetical protein